MAKPQPRDVPSDDCTVTRAGVEYAVHEGESVTLYPGARVGDWLVMEQFLRIEPELDAVRGTPEEAARTVAIIGAALELAVPLLTERLTAWTWTDDRGTPLPQPAEGVAAFRGLSFEELGYLVAVACRNESPAEEKKGSNGSPTTSSATSRTTTRRR